MNRFQHHFTWITARTVCLGSAVALVLAGCQSSVRFASTWPYKPAPTEEATTGKKRLPASIARPRERGERLASAAHKSPRTEEFSEQQGIMLDAAESWLSVPYLYGASSRSGTDCSGFTLRMYEEIGILLPRSSSEQFVIGRAVEPERLQAGDLLFFNTFGSGVSHVGLYVGSNEMIHASSKHGVIRQTLEGYYVRTFIGAKRVLPDAPARPAITATRLEDSSQPNKE